jgi:cell division protein FtsX
MTIAMILTTAISIGLFGGGLLVVRLADNSRKIYLDRVESQVFLTNDVSANDPTCDGDPCKALRAKIEARDDVKSVRFLNRDDAYNDAIKKFPQYKDVAGKDAFPGIVHRQTRQSRAAQGFRPGDGGPAGRAERAEPEGPDRPIIRGARWAVQGRVRGSSGAGGRRSSC